MKRKAYDIARAVAALRLRFIRASFGPPPLRNFLNSGREHARPRVSHP